MVESVVIRITGKYVDDVSSNVRKSGVSLKSLGAIGAATGVALAGVGAASVKMAMDMNRSMANVATLIPGNVERVNELKRAVQDLAIETGKSTQDLADGLYQVVSAFGDTADSANILEIAAKAATAGVATTTDSINLISAVTKGYGDTSAEAAQKASDLAFQTVKMGQTTFPELAGAIGRVVPLAKSLGVEQENLFAQMATLTGVTGNAAEVSTQLRSAYQALIKPSEEMSMAIGTVIRDLQAQGKLVDGPLVQAWRSAQQEFGATINKMNALEQAGKGNTREYKTLAKEAKELKKVYQDASAALGPTIIESLGFKDALSAITETAGGNTNVLAKMFGSVEGLNAVLALTGSQADVFSEKLAAMQEVSGATNEAFNEQTQGVNKAGFTIQQMQQRIVVLMQTLGDALIPALTEVGNALMPSIEAFAEWATEMLRNEEVIRTIIESIKLVVEAIKLAGETYAWLVDAAATAMNAVYQGIRFWVDEWNRSINLVKSAWSGFLSVLETLWDATIGKLIEGAKLLFHWIDPTKPKSPALVDVWAAGMKQMATDYLAFVSTVMATPAQPQFAFAGNGAFARGPQASTTRSVTHHHNYYLPESARGSERSDEMRRAREYINAVTRVQRSGILR